MRKLLLPHAHNEGGACACHDDGCGCGHEHAHGETSALRALLPLAGAAVLFGAGFLASGSARIALFCAAYLFAGAEVIWHAVRGVARGKLFDEQVLMTVATVGALALGDFAEAAAVMLFYRIGEYLQELAVRRSRKRISEAVELHPDQAFVLRGAKPAQVAPEEVQVGERILVRVGDRLPLDGVVEAGESLLNVAMLTGEPAPVRVSAGSEVRAGSINTLGALTVRVTKPASESATSRLLRAVEDAAENKPAIERFITRFSRVYTPCVVAAAALLAVLPPLLGFGEFSDWLRRALIFLVISCPCALVLSIPLAFFAGLAICSKQNVLCKGADALEAAAGISAVVFDKTGTLTKGEYRVQSVTAEGMEESKLLSYAAALEKDSLHPIARAILAAAEPSLRAEGVQERAGMGVSGTLEGKRVLAGNASLLRAEGIEPPSDASGVLVAVDGRFAGAVRVGDELRTSAEAAVLALNEAVGYTAILTGDAEAPAREVANRVGASELYAGLLPEEKLARIRAIRAARGKTMFVGDGINDAPVLAGADVGVAMGETGAEMAAEAADILLLTDDLTRLPFAVRAAKKTRATARRNIVIALAIKTAAMALAALGLAGMWVAVAADAGAALVCVLHTLGLFRRAA